MVFFHLQQYPSFNMAEIPNTAEPRYLTTEDIDEIFRNNHNSMEYVSKFESSTDDSTQSSFWESSTLDDSTETGSELSSIHSGSEPEEAGLLQPRKASAVKRVSTFAKSSPAKRIRLESKSLSSSSDEETSNKDGDEGDKTFQRRRQGGRGGRGGRRGREGQEASRGQGLSSGRRTTRDRRGRGSSRRKS